MATIGSLAVNIVATTDKFIAGLHNASNSLKKFQGMANKISIAAGGMTTALIGAVKWFEATGSELHDMSVATGIGVEQLDFLQYAAEQSGASLESITKAARELQAKGIDPNKFEEIAASLTAVEDPTARAARTFEIFGKRAGSAILPMLKDLPALRKEFQEIGGGITQQMADRADELGDKIGKLTRQFRNLTFGVVDYLVQHPKLFGALVAVLGTLTLLAPALYTVTAAIGLASIAVKGLGIALAFASANPIVLTIAAITAGIASLVYIIANFQTVWEKFKQAASLAPRVAGAAVTTLTNNPALGALTRQFGQQTASQNNSGTSNEAVSLQAQANGLLQQLVNKQEPQPALVGVR